MNAFLYWLKLTLLPLAFFLVAFLCLNFLPPEWGDRRALATILALLGAMILFSDMIILGLGRIFSPYSSFWCFIIAPGTILHECGHLLACYLTGLKVKKFRPFSPNPDTGQLGYVSYAVPPPPARFSVIQGLIVAMAPFASGALAIWGLLVLIAPDFSLPVVQVEDLSGLQGELERIYEQLRDGLYENESLGPWRFLALYGILAIGSGAAPSTTDFTIPFRQGARAWVGAVIGLVFLALLTAFVLKLPNYAQPIIGLLAIATASQLVTLGIVFSIRAVVSLFKLLGFKTNSNEVKA